MRVRIQCENLHPNLRDGMEYGLQDKAGHLSPPVGLPEGTIQVEGEIQIKPSAQLDFAGPYVHGKPGERFLYISFRRPGETVWCGRMKIPLVGVPEDAATATDGVILARVSGTRPDGRPALATLPLLDEGWHLVTP